MSTIRVTCDGGQYVDLESGPTTPRHAQALVLRLERDGTDWQAEALRRRSSGPTLHRHRSAVDLDGNRTLRDWQENDQATGHRTRYKIECGLCGLSATARQETLNRVCDTLAEHDQNNITLHALAGILAN